MLNMAAGLLEQGHYESPYELVMADEFQTLRAPVRVSAVRWSANRAAICLRWAMTGSRSIASLAPTFR